MYIKSVSKKCNTENIYYVKDISAVAVSCVLRQLRKLCKCSKVSRYQTFACCNHVSKCDVLFWSHTGNPGSVVVLLLLMVFLFGVKSLQQGSQDAPWDLLVLVYQRLDCLLHLQNKIVVSSHCFVGQLTLLHTSYRTPLVY